MSNIEKIGKIELIALFITIVSNNIIINIPTILLNTSSTGSWINIIYLTIICLIFILLVCKFFKPFISYDLLDISDYLGGKFLKYIIAFLYILLFLSFSALCVRYFSNSLKTIYFDSTPLSLLVLLFIIPTAITAKAGLKAVSGSNIIFAPISIAALIIFLFGAWRFFDWQNIFPIFGYGIKQTFFTDITNIFVFNVVAYLYFLKPFLKSEKHYKLISIIAVVLCGIYLLLCIVSLLMTFSFITQTDETLSVYLITRLISFGRFFQRIDAIFIFIWLLVIFSFLSLNLYLISHIIKKTLKLNTHSELAFPCASLLFSLSLIFKDIAEVKYITSTIYRFYAFILVFILSFVILVLGFIKKKRRKGVTK